MPKGVPASGLKTQSAALNKPFAKPATPAKTPVSIYIEPNTGAVTINAPSFDMVAPALEKLKVRTAGAGA